MSEVLKFDPQYSFPDIPPIYFDVYLEIEEARACLHYINIREKSVSDAENDTLVAMENIMEDLKNLDEEHGFRVIHLHVYELGYFKSFLEVSIDLALTNQDFRNLNYLSRTKNKIFSFYKQYAKLIERFAVQRSRKEKADILWKLWRDDS